MKFNHIVFPGEIRGLVPMERLMVIFAMLTGYIEHIMIFFGRLTATLTKLYRRQYIFSKRLQQIIILLNDWKVEKELKVKLFWFKYDMFATIFSTTGQNIGILQHPVE